MRNTIKSLIACAIILITSVAVFAAPSKEITPVKYVFLFIGDGMSIPQRMMAEEFSKLNGKEPLAINSLPNNAITYTRSNDSFITDSAASGTAIACGEKTDNGKIGVSPDKKPLESIAYVAQKNGKKVGILTSVTINHATPAAFYAHNSSRDGYYEIALDMIASNFDFFGGGGINKNDDSKSKSYKGDAYQLAAKAGYKVIREDTDAFAKISKSDTKVMAFGNFEALPYALDDNSGWRIKHFLTKAIEVLDNPNGFFIMTEGGKIDWMCHANDAAAVLQEILDFDDAVKVALDFAKKHPNETLIVVTGDHETGGLTLGFAGTGYKSYINLISNQKLSCGTMAKELAKFKKGKENFKFDDTKEFIAKYTGLKFEGDKKDRMVLTNDEKETLKKSFSRNLQKTDKPERFIHTLINCLDNKAALAWTSGAHTALPVSTTATGKNAEAFNGTIDNTDIAKILKKAVKR